MAGRPQRRWVRNLALAVMCAAMYVIAGIRAYVAFLIVVGIFATSVLYVFRQSRDTLVPHVLNAVVAIALLWVCFARGAGPYYVFYESQIASVLPIPGVAVRGLPSLDTARMAFENAGGRTNVVRQHMTTTGVGGALDRLETMAVGIVLLTVPAAAVDAIGIPIPVDSCV
jgi:hypothetical protein